MSERWALVLTGGANRGALQAGGLQALFETGFQPELIIGVSVGAINGSFLSFGPDLDRVGELARLWDEISTDDVFGTRLTAIHEAAAFLLGRQAAFDNTNLRRTLERNLPSRSFDDCSVPFIAVATDLKSGAERILREGDLIDAVIASSAIPGYFPPVELGGERLVDGAVSNPAPVDLAVARGFTNLVVVQTGHPTESEEIYESAVSIMEHAVAVMSLRLVHHQLRALPAAVRLVDIQFTTNQTIPLTDFSRTSEMREDGYREARAFLERIRIPWQDR